MSNALSSILDYEFKNTDLLTEALTHRSVSHGKEIGYERLEFLGDRVLGLCVADMLMKAFPHEPEGALSRRLNAMVRQEALAEIAEDIGLADHILLGKAESDGGARQNPAILSDICEAIIAALYLDGGLAASKRFIEKYWTGRLERSSRPPKDAKSSLQEWAMARKLPLPEYEVVEQTGPDHAPVFTIRVSVRGREPVEAQGDSKRVAEQKAAKELIEKLLKERK